MNAHQPMRRADVGVTLRGVASAAVSNVSAQRRTCRLATCGKAANPKEN